MPSTDTSVLCNTTTDPNCIPLPAEAEAITTPSNPTTAVSQDLGTGHCARREREGRSGQARSRAQAPHQPPQDGLRPSRERSRAPDCPVRQGRGRGPHADQTALNSAADIEDELVVTLAPLSSAHRSNAVASLCDELNARVACTNLVMRWAVRQPSYPPKRTIHRGLCQEAWNPVGSVLFAWVSDVSPFVADGGGGYRVVERMGVSTSLRSSTG